jgi:outer membrane protein TolC
LPYIRLAYRSISIGLCAGMLAGLAGCASDPDFKPPAAPAGPDVAGYTATVLPAQTVTAPIALGGAQRFVAGAPVATEWWRQFGSAKLDVLIEAALRANPTLEAAEAAEAT